MSKKIVVIKSNRMKPAVKNSKRESRHDLSENKIFFEIAIWFREQDDKGRWVNKKTVLYSNKFLTY